MTSVTFLFGPGLPILFPIALFGLIVQYTLNRVQLAYLKNRPPVYDDSINTQVIVELRYAPLLYVIVGAWFYSNQQTFRNSVSPLYENSLFMKSNHEISDLWSQLTPGTVFFLYLLLMIVLLLKRIVSKCNPEHSSIRKKIEKFEVMKNLANFYSSLKSSHRISLIKEEVSDYCRLGIGKLSKESLTQLVLNPKADYRQRLDGDCSYSILMKPQFEEFSYLPTQYKKNPYLRQCNLDIVSAAINLAYLDPQEARSMQFTTEYFFTRRQQLEDGNFELDQ